MIAYLIYVADLGRRAGVSLARTTKLILDSYIEAQEIRRNMKQRWTVE